MDTTLVDTTILTGHPQTIRAELTSKGLSDAADPSRIRHTVTPSSGVSVVADDTSGLDAPDLVVTVTDPGSYRLESSLNGVTFDQIDLSFEAPAEYDLITWLRPKDADEFETVNDAVTSATEGDQAAFLAVPYNTEGVRIAGDMTLGMTASPEWAVTQGFNVLGIYEQRVSGSPAPVSVYFIEPGPVDINWTDAAHGLTVTHSFDVEAIAAN